MQVLMNEPRRVGAAQIDDSVERFLESLKSSTANTYGISFKTHILPFLSKWSFRTRSGQMLQFTTFKEVLDEITRDQRRDVADKEMFERELIKAFVKYLNRCNQCGSFNVEFSDEEITCLDCGNDHVVVQAPKSQTNRVAAIQSCAKYWGVTISTKWTNLPAALTQTESYDWSIATYAIFNALLRSPEYRAFDAYLYQSGLGKGDVVIRKYGEIKKEYEAFIFNGEATVPCYKLTRGKTKVTHHSCLSDEAMILLKPHFDQKYGENGVPQPNERIFDLNERPINEVYVDRAHKMIGTWPYSCPMAPHSRRKFFRKRMVKVGKMPSEYAEYFEGHEIGGSDMKKTYSTMGVDSWREIYMEYKDYLAFPILPYDYVAKLMKRGSLDDAVKAIEALMAPGQPYYLRFALKQPNLDRSAAVQAS